MGCTTVLLFFFLQIQISIPLFSLPTIFSSGLPLNFTPCSAPGVSADITGAQITPGTLSLNPFKVSGDRWKHLCLLNETGSSASQNIVSTDLLGVIHLSEMHVFTCIVTKASRRSDASDHSVVIKEGKQNLPAADLSQEMKRWAPAAHSSRYASWGCAMFNTFRVKRIKWLTVLRVASKFSDANTVYQNSHSYFSFLSTTFLCCWHVLTDTGAKCGALKIHLF